ncbi:MAG: TonB-dependent receptor [Thiobacillaceae bacterium]
MHRNIALAMTLSFILPACAEELPVTLAAEIVVTATRSPQKLDDTLADVSVLTRKDIAASGAADLPALLQRLPGVEISQQGGLGTVSAVRIRGAESDHTLVLVDGMRLNSVSAGTTAIDQIMLDEVERIEIVRGNVSSLYGSEAIGGVVQIFTRHGSGPAALSVKVGLGTDDYNDLAASIGGALSADTRMHFGMSHVQSRGFSTVREQFIPTAGYLSLADLDKDTTRNLSVNFNVEHSLGGRLRVGLNAAQSVSSVEYDGEFSNHDDQTLAGYSLYLDADPSNLWHTRITLGEGEDNLKNDLSGTSAGYFNTRNDQVHWENQLQIGKDANLRFGLEAMRQGLSSDSNYSVNSRVALSGYEGYGQIWGRHQLDLSARFDHYSDFGGHATGRLAYGYQLAPSLKIHGALATAFKAPTFNDLYLNYPPYYFANPNLKPETSESAELGFSYGTGEQFVQATLFASRSKDLIAIDPVTYATTVNLNRTRNQGLEMSWQGRVAGLAARAAYTWQNPEDEATGLTLLRRARQFGSLAVRDQAGAFGWQAEMVASASRPDVDIIGSSRTRVPGYALLDLAGDYALKKNWRVGARLINAGDVDYSLVYGYHTPGREFRLELAYQPN